MPKRANKPHAGSHAGDMAELARLFDDFDYRVETDEFVLYEIDRLIEEDRASFEDEEFRRVIDEGIRQHIEERLEIRSAMAVRLRTALPRFDSSAQKVGRRTLRALEDIRSPLHSASIVV